MEKIDRDALEVPADDIYNVFAGKLVASLDGEAIKRAYTSSWYGDEMYILMGLLHKMCQDYIKSKGLAPGDMEYSQLVDNLAALTGLTNDDYCLDAGEMQYCIENELIPINMDTINGPLEPSEPVRFISKSHFDDIIRLASFIMTGYEDTERQTKKEPEKWLELVSCARDTCERLYHARKSFIEYCKRKDAENINIDVQPSGDALDFEL